jgi:hypothetical protein
MRRGRERECTRVPCTYNEGASTTFGRELRYHFLVMTTQFNEQTKTSHYKCDIASIADKLGATRAVEDGASHGALRHVVSPRALRPGMWSPFKSVEIGASQPPLLLPYNSYAHVTLPPISPTPPTPPRTMKHLPDEIILSIISCKSELQPTTRPT